MIAKMPDSFQQKLAAMPVTVPAPGWVNNIGAHIDDNNGIILHAARFVCMLPIMIIM